MKASNDHSIFVFEGEGMLARSPSRFHNSGQVKLLGDIGEPQAPYSITKEGLHIQIPLCDVTDASSGEKKTLALFNCCLDDESKRFVVALTASNAKGMYRRGLNGLHFSMYGWIPDPLLPAWQLHSIYIEDHIIWRVQTAAGPTDSFAHSLLMTAIVPADYGKLKLSMNYRQSDPIEQLAENEWGMALRRMDDLALKFENGTSIDDFALLLGLSGDAVMFCYLDTPRNLVEELKFFSDRWSESQC
jgi:hypothetical protein